MTVLTTSNAYPGAPYPNHKSGQSKPQNFLYPAAVEPSKSVTSVLQASTAFPGIPFPNHKSGQSQPTNFLYAGGVQPAATIDSFANHPQLVMM